MRQAQVGGVLFVGPWLCGSKAGIQQEIKRGQLSAAVEILGTLQARQEEAGQGSVAQMEALHAARKQSLRKAQLPKERTRDAGGGWVIPHVLLACLPPFYCTCS